MNATLKVLSSFALAFCVAGSGQQRDAAARADRPTPFHTVVSGTDARATASALRPDLVSIPPGITKAGVLNSANPVPGAALAPGSLVTVQGDFPGIPAASITASPLRTAIEGFSIQFTGPSVTPMNAPLFYVSRHQVDIQIPWELAGKNQAALVASVTGGFVSSPEYILLAPFAPGLFSMDGLGSGQGAILDDAYEVVDTHHPAVAGSTLVRVYCTGLGAVENQPRSGTAAPASPLAPTTTAPTLTVGGVAANVLFSGLVPGFIGLYEVDATVPATAPVGDAVPVSLTIGGVVSNSVTIAVATTAAVQTPVITSVDPVAASPAASIVIHGHGFGNETVYGRSAAKLSLSDSTAKWSGNFNLSVISWTDTEIQAQCSGCNLNAGDQLTVSVNNAETNAGPASYIIPVGALQIVWSDEFNGVAGAKPDPAKWTYDLGGNGWGNGESEVYTDSADNAHTDGQGNLDIHVISSGNGYTSARLKTQGRFAVEHGRIEARMKIPAGQGIWPAFWMLGTNITTVNWPQCGEIDIMENIGKEPNIVHGSMHGPGYSGGSPITSSYSGPRFSDDFHTFAVQWSATAVKFYVDGNLYQTVTPGSIPAGTSWVFDNPFFLLLNVAVGGGWPGYPDKTSTFPQDMLVDYVRVYQEVPTFTLNPWSASLSAAASSGTLAVTSSAYGAAWSAVSNASWITVTTASGNGNGSVAYAVQANTTHAARSGTITVAGQTFTVNQSN